MVVTCVSCGEEPRGSPAPRTFTDTSAHVLHIGLDDSAPAEAAIGRVIAARMTEGGRHVVVLDFVDPFIKVFDGRGRFQTAFLKRGGGPGESRGPDALATSGDSLVLVAAVGEGISLFTLAGEPRARARIQGLIPLAATSWCGGEWLVYGPRTTPGTATGTATGTRRAPWLHRIRAVSRDSFEVTSMMVDEVPRSLPAGLAYGLVRDGDGAVLRHTLGGRPRVYRVGCGGGEPRLVNEAEPQEQEAPKDRGTGVVTASIRVGMKFPGGLAAVDGRVVVAEKVYVGDGDQRLDLTLVNGSGAATPAGSIAGNFALADSHPGVGVLVTTSDPVPQLFLLRSRDFLKILGTP
jgi:hypothetical protein